MGIQEADIVTLVKPITKYAVMINEVSELAYHIDKAIYLAREGRPGPVWIDVPLDIQNMMVDEEKLIRFTGKYHKPELKGADIEYVKEAFSKAERPVFLIGEGVRRAKAVETLRDIANKHKVPVLFSRFAADMLPYSHPLNFGIVGAGGAHRNANFTVQNADLVISIGCRLSTEVIGVNKDEFAREAKVFVVDIDRVEHLKKGARIDRFIHADALDFLNALNESGINDASKEWIDKCAHWKKVFPRFSPNAGSADTIDIKYFLSEFSNHLPDKATILADAGLTGAVTASAINTVSGQRIISSVAQGEMGYSLPGAFGVAELSECVVVAVCGDGSVMMNLQELQTLVRNQYNIKVIIINNDGYSGVRHGQKAHFRGKSIGTDPSNGLDFPNFGKVADAFEINYVHIRSTSEIDAGIKETLKDDNPCICEVDCDPEQVDLHSGLVKYDKRKFGFRPLEDYAPFIDRELFFSEMIVEPLPTSYGEPV